MQQFQPDSSRFSLPAREGTLQYLAQVPGPSWNWIREMETPHCSTPALSMAKTPQILPFLTLFPHLCLFVDKSQSPEPSYSFRIHLKTDFFFCFIFFPAAEVGVCGKVCSFISSSFQAWGSLSPVAHTKFQSHLSTTSSHSGALPRSAGQVSDPKVHGQPKKKYLLNTNIQLFITKERENNWKKMF